jgi:hypothetical protein
MSASILTGTKQRRQTEAERQLSRPGGMRFFACYSGLLISHGVTDIRPGFEEAWQRYRQTRTD